MCAGATRPGSAAMRRVAGRGSRTRCWWTCASGCAARRARTGSSRLVGRRRVLDSTPLYDAVATADTVTLIRSALRGLLAAAAAADFNLAAALHAVLTSGDGYASRAKPQIDWDDPVAREELIDSRARDGFAVLAALDGRELADPVGQAAALLATV